MRDLANDVQVLYEPGGFPTCMATTAVRGKRFVTLSGNRTAGPGLNEDVTGGIYRVKECDAAGQWAVGVAKMDGDINKPVGIIAKPGIIIPVTAGGAIAAGAEVMSDSQGRAVAVSAAAAAVAASLATGVVANNNAIRWTAKNTGVPGNGITIDIVVAGASTPLTVDVDGNAITVNVATNSGSAATSTAAQVMAAVAEHDTASQLVSTANEGASSGAGVVVDEGPTALAGGAAAGAYVAAGRCMTAASALGVDAEIKLY